MTRMSLCSPLVYYQLSHSDYQPTMDKHVFHDSGIADEGLSDDTGSIEGDSHNKENRSGN